MSSKENSKTIPGWKEVCFNSILTIGSLTQHYIILQKYEVIKSEIFHLKTLVDYVQPVLGISLFLFIVLQVANEYYMKWLMRFYETNIKNTNMHICFSWNKQALYRTHVDVGKKFNTTQNKTWENTKRAFFIATQSFYFEIQQNQTKKESAWERER